MLFSDNWLQNSGAKEVHYEGENSNKIVDGYTQIDKICKYLKDGKCSIYETRPKTCRDFEVCSKKCLIVMKAKNPALYNTLL